MTLDKLPRSEEDDFSAAIVGRRLALAERAAGGALPGIAGAPTAPSEARGNIEGLIGFVQTPVGLAGPLVVETSAKVTADVLTSEQKTRLADDTNRLLANN